MQLGYPQSHKQFKQTDKERLTSIPVDSMSGNLIKIRLNNMSNLLERQLEDYMNKQTKQHKNKQSQGQRR